MRSHEPHNKLNVFLYSNQYIGLLEREAGEELGLVVMVLVQEAMVLVQEAMVPVQEAMAQYQEVMVQGLVDMELDVEAMEARLETEALVLVLGELERLELALEVSGEEEAPVE